MEFYADIAEYYDDIFPVAAAQLQLITQVAGPPPGRILDAACGSGGYAIALKEAGYDVTAIDLDPNMIRQARDKDPDLQAHVMDMRTIDRLLDPFDVIFCIGNSVVHLDSLSEINRFMRACATQLHSSGKLILQTVNYDRITARQITALPLIRNEEKSLIFERYYQASAQPDKLDFCTELTVSGRVLSNRVALLPVLADSWDELLKQAGFRLLDRYGRFDKQPFDPMESFHLILVAEPESS